MHANKKVASISGYESALELHLANADWNAWISCSPGQFLLPVRSRLFLKSPFFTRAKISDPSQKSCKVWSQGSGNGPGILPAAILHPLGHHDSRICAGASHSSRKAIEILPQSNRHAGLVFDLTLVKNHFPLPR